MAVINLLKLSNRCHQSVRKIMKEVGLVTVQGKRYAFKDNGSPVLAVAHCDSLQQYTHFAPVGDRVYCPTLDDRLGVYTILDVLPRLGVVVDVLLTDGEESMSSSAAYFDSAKQYNWIVEFDRQGDDAVTYQFDWSNTVKDYFKVSLGSYSDISWLGHLGCQAVNVGIGYHDHHTRYAYFEREEYELQLARFLPFYFDLKNTRFDFKETTATPFTWYGDGYRDGYQWNDLDDAEAALYVCPKCKEQFYGFESATTIQAALCPNCHTWCALGIDGEIDGSLDGYQVKDADITRVVKQIVDL